MCCGEMFLCTVNEMLEKVNSDTMTTKAVSSGICVSAIKQVVRL